MCPHSLSVRQLIVKYSPAHAKISSPIFVNNCFIDKIVPPSTVSLILTCLLLPLRPSDMKISFKMSSRIATIEVYSNQGLIAHKL